MERAGAARGLESVTSHDLQCMRTQRGAIRRYQDMAVSLCQFEGIDEQLFEIVLNVKRLSSGRTRKSWRIKNNDIKLLPLPR